VMSNARGRRDATVRLHPANEVANRSEPLRRSGYYLRHVIFHAEAATCSTTSTVRVTVRELRQ